MLNDIMRRSLFTGFHVVVRGMLLVVQLVEALRYKQKVAGSIPDGVNGIFH